MLKKSILSVTNTAEKYHHIQKRKNLVILILALVLAAAVVVSLGIGSVYLSPLEIFQSIGNAIFGWIEGNPDSNAGLILLQFRLPRIILAILTGIALALAGAVMQGLLRNPLVSPFTLGLSSAASFGAALIMVVGPILFGAAFTGSLMIIGLEFTMKSLLVILSAFVFGMLSIFLVYLISRVRQTSQAMMILAGVVIGYLFQAGLLALKYVSNDEALREIVTWLMGGMWGATWPTILILTPIVMICFFLMLRRSWDLNTLSAGDDVAKNMGINVDRLRITGLVIVGLAASACLAFTGIIGFVGLMAPHICRMLVGNDHRYLLPASVLMGAIILLVSDTVGRVILAPMELPVGIIMYIIGGIFFLVLILKGRGRYLS